VMLQSEVVLWPSSDRGRRGRVRARVAFGRVAIQSPGERMSSRPAIVRWLSPDLHGRRPADPRASLLQMPLRRWGRGGRARLLSGADPRRAEDSARERNCNLRDAASPGAGRGRRRSGSAAALGGIRWELEMKRGGRIDRTFSARGRAKRVRPIGERISEA
jgi:hypothetical protein